MNNKKGQALVEFIIIMPIVIMLIVSMIDFGTIIISKYSLTNDLEVITDLYENNKSEIDNYKSKHNLNISYKVDNTYTTIIVKKNVKITSIMLVPVLGKTYEIEADRTIVNEQ